MRSPRVVEYWGVNLLKRQFTGGLTGAVPRGYNGIGLADDGFSLTLGGLYMLDIRHWIQRPAHCVYAQAGFISYLAGYAFRLWRRLFVANFR